MRVLLRVLFAAAAAMGSASAADEEACRDRYSLEEQVAVEWAALGGDPHAQFAIAKCAAPKSQSAFTPAEKTYALKWLTLATCDAARTEEVADRDRMTRRLKYQGDLSFRRFGGITSSETWNAREKKLIAYRKSQIADLEARFADVSAHATSQERSAAQQSLSNELARMGDLGLLRLAALTSCGNFGASEAFAAAAWSAADHAWKASGHADVYGAPSKKKWSISQEAETRMQSLSPAEVRIASSEKERLLRTDPLKIAELEDQAALAKLDRLAFLHAQSGHVSFAGRAVTTAVQYALESLGWIEFVNGPDNDYGPSTIEAVARAQAAYGFDETRWLSHEEVRKLVCDAATEKDDPISYFHLSVMFSEGWGFRQDLARASFAINKAKSALSAKLANAEALPEWKRTAYANFEPRIDSAKRLIEREAPLALAHTVPDASVTKETLCN